MFMNSTIKLFGKRIKEIRKHRGITQEKLAEMLELDNQTISRIETGSYFTSYENLEKMARILNSKIKDFFDFEHLRDENELKSYLIDKIGTLNAKELQKITKFVQEFI